MYHIDLLRGIRKRRGGGSRTAAVLLAATALLLVADTVLLRKGVERWEGLAAGWEEELGPVETREKILSPSLEARLLLVQRRADRVLWRPLFTRLADLLPDDQALESVRYDGEDRVLVIEMRGWGEDGSARFVSALRSDTLFARFFPRAEEPVPIGGGRRRIVCFREGEG